MTPTLEIIPFVLGPLENNTYLLADPDSGAAVVVDPSYDSASVLEVIAARGWRLEQVWLTHAHFDHFIGLPELIDPTAQPAIPYGLHPADLPLLREGGGARLFGIYVPALPEPTLAFEHGQRLAVGQCAVEVCHAPGHSPGHVMFYIPTAGVMLCGDVIFQGSIGRTDLSGGNFNTLINSIRAQVLTLPPETRLLSGHGPETSVAEEQSSNPFL